jgi:large subunit ribosomal protein L25
MHEVEVKCNPSKIPDRYDVNIEKLEIGNSIHVSDLPKLDGVEIVSDARDMVVSVSAPVKEEEVAAGPTEAEVLAEKTPEGEAPAAGAKTDAKADAKPKADAKAPAADAKAAKPEKK